MSQNKYSPLDNGAALQGSGDAWRFYVDRGGNFHRCGGRGALTCLKLPSRDIRTDDAARAAIRRCLGLDGGESALPGANMVIRADGETIALKGRDEIAVEAGDGILIATPGGGFGKDET